MGYTRYAYVKLTTLQVCELIEALAMLEASAAATHDYTRLGNLVRLRDKLQAAVPMPREAPR